MGTALRGLFAIASHSALMGLGLAAVAQAPPRPADAPQTKPAGAKPAETKPAEPDKVVVKAATPDVVTQIDRQVYDVSKDPQYQSGSAGDVLAKLPEVTVQAGGQLRLLGNLSVTVLVDGKRPLSQDIIKVMPASEIDRIEVMTNPSAQYAAQTSGGIINIITRRRTGPGLQGGVTLAADQFGGAQLNVSPTWTLGQWSLGGVLAWIHNVSESESERDLQQPGGAAPVSTFESRQNNSLTDQVLASVRLGYKPASDRSFSLTLSELDGDTTYNSATRATSNDPGFPAYTEGSSQTGGPRQFGAALDYDWTGKSPNEKLTASAQVTATDWKTANTFARDFDDATRPDTQSRTDLLQRNQYLSLKTDYQTAPATRQLLTTGALWTRDALDNTDSADFGVGNPLTHAPQTIRGHRDILAAYATYQLPVGKWTLLPGVRAEAETVEIESPNDTEQHDTRLFPSLYINRQLSSDLKLVLSYSERIDRPNLRTFTTTLVYNDSTYVSVGNPDLRPSILHNYEGKLDYRLGKQQLNLTAYDRRTDDIVTVTYQVLGNGVILATNVNGGSTFDRGVSLSVRGPIGAVWRYQVSADAYEHEGDQLDQGVVRRRSDFAYSGNARIEYHLRNDAGQDSDQIELAARFRGPTEMLQGHSSAYWSTDLTWRHALTRKADLVLNVYGLLGAQSNAIYLESPAFIQQTRYFREDPRVKLSLTYKLGPAPPG